MASPQQYPFQGNFFVDTLPVKRGVYAICHTSGKVYVGATGKLCERWKQHRQRLRRGNHYNPELQQIFNRDGEGSLSFVILEPTSRRDHSGLQVAERKWINIYKQERGVFNVY